MMSKMIQLVACAALAAAPGGVWGLEVTEVLGVRTPLTGQGYLQHKVNDAAGINRFGNEVTGWIDVRHPAMDGTEMTFEPYDYSNHFVNTRSITVTAEKEGGGADEAAAPQVQRDYDRTAKIYAQAGISVFRAETATLNLDGNGGRPDVQWPINTGGEDDDMKELARSGNAKTVNMYWVQKYGGSNPNGLTSPPSGFGANMPRNDGSGVADQAEDSTFAHELGHMLLNGNALHMEDATPTESADMQNWMFRTGNSYDFDRIGNDRGRIESVQLNRLYANGGANNPGFVQLSTGHEDYGNRVDWAYVSDDRNLENRDNGADDHKGVESLYFEPGMTAAINQAGQDNDDLGDFDPMVTDYDKETFTFADVFSLTTRYSDFDRFNAGGDFSDRNGALDYEVVFVDENNQNHPGILHTIFDFGWTTATHADNYLGRWRSPVEAIGLFVLAKTADGTFDGNTQIDAVIVGVPEPASVGLVLLLGAAACGRRRRN